MTDIGRYKQTVISTDGRANVHHSDSPDLAPYNGTWNRLGTLGAGAFGTVYRESCSENGKVRAVKEVEKRRTEDIHREIQCLIKVREVSDYSLPSFRPPASDAH